MEASKYTNGQAPRIIWPEHFRYSEYAVRALYRF